MESGRNTRRFVGSEVVDPHSAAFDTAWGVLADYFAPRNEIEPREALQAWIARSQGSEAGTLRYHLLTWHVRDDAGEPGALAGVRDCFVGVDPHGGWAMALLSHSFVVAPFRRSGVSALLRDAPATLIRSALARAGLDREQTPTLLVAEMEPLDPEDPDTWTRLVSYGKAGFQALLPAALPYVQPDFRPNSGREPVVDSASFRHVPLALLIRRLDREAETLPRALAAAIVRQIGHIHAHAVSSEAIREVTGWSLAGLERWSGEVPLVRLSGSGLVPLLRSRLLTHAPPGYQRPDIDPEAELARFHELLARRP